MCKSGFDWLAVDLEHSTITLREAEDLIRVIDLKGVVPLVRLSTNNPEQIKRVMDEQNREELKYVRVGVVGGGCGAVGGTARWRRLKYCRGDIDTAPATASHRRPGR